MDNMSLDLDTVTPPSKT